MNDIQAQAVTLIIAIIAVAAISAAVHLALSGAHP